MMQFLMCIFNELKKIASYLLNFVILPRYYLSKKSSQKMTGYFALLQHRKKSFQDLFCSEACLAEAMRTYHPVEAAFAHVLSKSETIRLKIQMVPRQSAKCQIAK
jgi:hypothetical protein